MTQAHALNKALAHLSDVMHQAPDGDWPKRCANCRVAIWSADEMIEFRGLDYCLTCGPLATKEDSSNA